MAEEFPFSFWSFLQILLSGLFQNGECYLRLLCEAQYTRFWMKLFMPDKLVNGMFKFAEELNSCELSYAEIVILCGIQLTEIGIAYYYIQYILPLFTGQCLIGRFER